MSKIAPAAPSAELASIRRISRVVAGCAVAAAAGTLVLLLAATGPLSLGFAIAASAVTAGAALCAAAFAVITRRQADVDLGRPDLYLHLNQRRSEAALRAPGAWRAGPMRRVLANLLGHPLMVGDRVRIKSHAEILATLDTDGTLEGLPFMREMEQFCGREAIVYRVVDKIYDYGRSRRMRRLDRSVLLLGLRCDGADHGGCEAACYLIWKTDWLQPVADTSAQSTLVVDTPSLPLLDDQRTSAPLDPAAAATVYRCQYVALTGASAAQPLHAARTWLAPWCVGNVTAAAWTAAMLSRLANALQAARNGVAYPARPRSERGDATTPAGLAAGQWVRINTPAQIARTLDSNSKNRGLWFDADMLKHAGQPARVLGRVDLIIDITSRRMIRMKTPCIVLEGVHYSGEFQNFGEQHDFLYWREAWLTPITANCDSNDSAALDSGRASA